MKKTGRRRPNQPSPQSNGNHRRPRSTPRPDRESATPEEVSQTTELLTGRHPVASALDSNRPINKVLVAEGAAQSRVQHIVAKAREKGIVVQFVPRSRLDALTDGVHQGVAAYVAPYEYVDLADITSRTTGQPPLVVVLDGIHDPHNLGAIIRTAEAAGAQGVVIGKHRAAPVTETVAKAAAGALEHLPVARVANIVQALQQLKDEGYWLVGTTTAAENRLSDVDYRGKTVVVVGAEATGLHRLVEENCDFLVSIPILGHVQSLNASVASGVVLYEVVRQRT